MIHERVAPVAEIESVPLGGGARPRDRARHRGAAQPAAVRQFGGRRLRGAPRRSRSASARRGWPWPSASPPAAPPRTRSRPGEAIRIFTGAPMPAARRHRVHAGGLPRRRHGRDRAGGPRARRQPPARRRGPARRVADAAGRPPAHRAARGARRRGRAHRAAGAAPGAHRGVLDRRRDRGARRGAAGGGAVRRQPLPARGPDRAPRRCRRPTSASCPTTPTGSAARSRPRRRITIWC